MHASYRACCAALSSALFCALSLWPGLASGEPAAPPTDASVLNLDAAALKECKVASQALAPEAIDAPISSLGTVAYDDGRLANVFSPVSGMVTAIIAPLGARVAAGAPLAVLTSADMAGAKADLDRASAALLAAREAAARQRRLFDERAASARDKESARDVLRRAEAEQARARAQYALLTGGKKNSHERNFTLRSPMAGEVVARDVGLGSQVRGQYAGGSPSPLFMVADLSTVWLMADLPENEAGRVARGATATVRSEAPPKKSADAADERPAGGVQPVVGTVDWVADVLDATSHTLKVRCVIDNALGRLRPNMRVVLDISGRIEGTVSVPTSSVVFIEQQPYVFVAGAAPQGGQSSVFSLRPVDLDDNSPGAQATALAGHGGGSLPFVHHRSDGVRAAVLAGHLPEPLQARRIVRRGLTFGDQVVHSGAACLMQRLAEAAAARAAGAKEADL